MGVAQLLVPGSVSPPSGSYLLPLPSYLPPLIPRFPHSRCVPFSFDRGFLIAGCSFIFRVLLLPLRGSLGHHEIESGRGTPCIHHQQQPHRQHTTNMARTAALASLLSSVPPSSASPLFSSSVLWHPCLPAHRPQSCPPRTSPYGPSTPS